MKKLILSITLFLILQGVLYSQNRLGLTLGPQISNGDFGFGLSAHYRYSIKQVRIGANLGYYSINGNRIIPITGAFEYVFKSKKIAPYIGSDIGIYSESAGTFFGLAPTLGLNVPVAKNIAFITNFKYNIIFNARDFIGVNFGLMFKI